ncbi:MAG: GAF domain-containing protein [Comamonadaceae bacterium]|nr:MAG: GAF domain-containing protein [Comamonadaceae bacterium]
MHPARASRATGIAYMTPFQALATELLLETGSSRVLIQIPIAGAGPTPVAEAVRDRADQIRNDVSKHALHALSAPSCPRGGADLWVQDDLEDDETEVARLLRERYGVQSQVVAPLLRGADVLGSIFVHRSAPGPAWDAEQLAAVCRARDAALALLVTGEEELALSKEKLRDAAIDTLLEELLVTLDVHRCTFRQDVSRRFAFPVTHEARAEGVRSLLGDMTIVQTGQPVIERMLKERVQVVQDECSTTSSDPAFHVAREHYGGMRSQIVTPLFRDNRMAGVLSIHSLQVQRSWSPREIAFARDAACFLGLLTGSTLA